MSIHEGHRKRLRERFRKEGPDNIEDLYILELLLCYTNLRKDVNEQAHNLLKTFGSLAGVLDASPKDIKKVEGVGEATADFIYFLKSVWRRYEVQKAKKDIPLTTLNECGEYIKPHFRNLDNETVFLLCLDAKRKALGCVKVGEGSVNSASISTRKIVEVALNSEAASVILAHNHPSGLAIPSPEDIQTTKRLGRALAAVDIVLFDHLVFADGDYVSLRQSGKYSYESCMEILV